MDDYITSSVSNIIISTSSISIQKGLSDAKSTLVSKSLALKNELVRIRLERKEAQSSHDEESKQYTAHLSYLKDRFHKQLKHQTTTAVYRRALQDNSSQTTRYVVDVQAKLLQNFHGTEIYRNQWELASNHLIAMTRHFMQQETLMKEETTSAQVRLMELTGHSSMPCVLDASMDDTSDSQRRRQPSSKRQRSRSLNMLQQTFASTMQQAKNKWGAVSSTSRGPQVQSLVQQPCPRVAF